MERRHLGTLATSALGLGCMGFSQGYGPADDSESIRAIRAAVDGGTTLLDTAMSYGAGHNERLLARARTELGPDSGRLQIATKFGIVRTAGGVRLDGHPGRVREYCDASLARLGVDSIDLYYLHRVDPDVPIEETVAAMAGLVAAGKVRHLGLSEVTPDQLHRAHRIHPIAAVQFEWSLLWREPEHDIVPAARDLGVGLVPYSPLGRGLLTATLDEQTVPASPFRAGDPRFNGPALSVNLGQVARLHDLAGDLDMTAGQLALSWLLGQGRDVVPVPGSRRPARAAENAAARPLTTEEMRAVDAAVDPEHWSGDRRSFAVPATARTTATQRA